jgi:catalase
MEQTSRSRSRGQIRARQGKFVPFLALRGAIVFCNLRSFNADIVLPNEGFPTGGSAHTIAYDFFTQHPEGAAQLMYALSDLGIPRVVSASMSNFPLGFIRFVRWRKTTPKLGF